MKVVVRIQEFRNERGSVFHLESPRGYDDPGVLIALQSDSKSSPFSEMQAGDGSPDRVSEAGKKLFADLFSHGAVGAAITEALREQIGGCSPVYFRLDDVTAAEDLPWEALCNEHKNEFLALDDRWPVARVRDAAEVDPRLLYDFEPPLRITVILSAAGNDLASRALGAPQWEGIKNALLEHLAEPKPLAVAVVVLVGESALKEAIEQLKLPWVQCRLITGREDLFRQIRKSRPHLLHFFCHGTADEIPYLKIGSFMDWEAEQEGSIAITATELREQADPNQEIWMVTLNCCESARQARDARSLASSLVSAGFPAALGMREVIDVQYAHRLCKFFYQEVLSLVDKASQSQEPIEIEWARALCKVRSSIAAEAKDPRVPAQQAARGCKTWTVPALYVRREAFKLRTIGSALAPSPVLSEEKMQQIDYLQGLQKQKSKAAEDYKDLPGEALKDILKDYDDQIALATQKLITIA